MRADPRTFAAAQRIVDQDGLDGYASKGILLSRDAAHLVLAALRRDAYEMETRGGQANLDGAAKNKALANAIVSAMRI